jgi:chaperonin cofactor prefoldin
MMPGSKPHIQKFAAGDYLVDTSRDVIEGPLENASERLKAYEAEIAAKIAEREEKFKNLKKKKSDDLEPTDEDVEDAIAYLESLDLVQEV